MSESRFMVIQIPVDAGNFPILHHDQNADEVDAILHFIESSFTDFPVENGCRQFSDNQFDTYVFERIADNYSSMEAFVCNLIDNAPNGQHEEVLQQAIAPTTQTFEVKLEMYGWYPPSTYDKIADIMVNESPDVIVDVIEVGHPMDYGIMVSHITS